MILNYQVIAVFTDRSLNYTGNPAACFYYKSPLTDEQMQQISTKVRQPASTFLWPAEEEGHFNVRWFAVDDEINLCGHGAAAAAIFLGKKFDTHEPFTLHHRKGSVRVQWQENDTFIIELEAIHLIKEIEVPAAIEEGLGIPIMAMYETDGKHIILVENEKIIKKMNPDFAKLRGSDIYSYAITAPGKNSHFVSRTLVPHYHQLEDHATGSSHAALVPFWSKKLMSDDMTALQLSDRGGRFVCRFREDRNKVYLEGKYQIIETCTVEI
ncbi:PhzF family phenazine biosynthesis protein [Litoribacter populi]|uniref:PhzF family phenazine biosynthesis protein n=1 Tax=Litoribacter populi TaxID=2598460 RepID=UPI0011802D51|nr:PhzF family phenazine biosynthesis protein [Litoribacter populi]